MLALCCWAVFMFCFLSGKALSGWAGFFAARRWSGFVYQGSAASRNAGPLQAQRKGEAGEMGAKKTMTTANAFSLCFVCWQKRTESGYTLMYLSVAFVCYKFPVYYKKISIEKVINTSDKISQHTTPKDSSSQSGK